jgi:hypothetical protein
MQRSARAIDTGKWGKPFFRTLAADPRDPNSLPAPVYRPIMRTRTFLFSLLAPALVLAQMGEPLDSVADVRLRAFERRMLTQPIQKKAPAPLNEYVLVWKEHNNGYFTTIVPGDTSITLFFVLAPEQQINLNFYGDGPTFYGERYAVLVRDRPVNMMDLTRWFFERRTERRP